jgi:hypothetical protein
MANARFTSIASLFLIAYGRNASIFPDAAWSDTSRSLRRAGIVPQRTSEWEHSRIAGALSYIILGIVLACQFIYFDRCYSPTNAFRLPLEIAKLWD